MSCPNASSTSLDSSGAFFVGSFLNTFRSERRDSSSTGRAWVADGWGGDPKGPFGEGFLIWDLADPENPKQLGHYRTGGLGTHRNFYAGGKYVYATALPEGYDGHILQIVDISDPAAPRRTLRDQPPDPGAAPDDYSCGHFPILARDFERPRGSVRSGSGPWPCAISRVARYSDSAASLRASMASAI